MEHERVFGERQIKETRRKKKVEKGREKNGEGWMREKVQGGGMRDMAIVGYI